VVTTLTFLTLAAVVIMVLLLLGVLGRLSTVASRSQQQIYSMAEHEGRTDDEYRTLKKALEKIDRAFAEEAGQLRSESLGQVRQLRDELATSLNDQAGTLVQRLTEVNAALQKQQASAQQYTEYVNRSLERLNRVLAEDAARARGENAAQAKLMRDEVSRNLKGQSDSLMERVAELTVALRNQQYAFHQEIGRSNQNNDRRLGELQQVFEKQLRRFEDGVDARLEQMRAAVDDQVQLTLDRGLGESFRLVRQQLETVQHNLSEMQSLASNVGDLKRVLTNVSTRGNWGVVRLASLLEQALSADQYAADVKTKRGSEERCQYAVRLPGKGAGREDAVWLPIDAGIPLSFYQRLIDARDGGDAGEIEAACAGLEGHVKARARFIQENFLDPPQTTEFALMFLPVEGMYAEVLRRHGLTDELQRESRIVVTGPTTLAALLNSLQMGFRTLAIEQRSMEVWRLLGAVKTEFDQFGRVLGAVQAKLQEASSTINDVQAHASELQTQLADVRELSIEEARAAIASPALPTAEAPTEPAPEETRPEPDATPAGAEPVAAQRFE